MEIRTTQIKKVLTRTSGYLKTVTSHSLQPYAGCALGSSLCGVGCYVRHNAWITRGRIWGEVAALRSDLGASFKILSLVGTDRFEICLSVPLALEYEEVLSREGVVPDVSIGDIQDLIDYLCSVAIPYSVFFLWRPLLKDPEDEMVLELAVAGGCDSVVTFNRRDFAGAERFGIQVVSPGEFLRQIGEDK